MPNSLRFAWLLAECRASNAGIASKVERQAPRRAYSILATRQDLATSRIPSHKRVRRLSQRRGRKGERIVDHVCGNSGHCLGAGMASAHVGGSALRWLTLCLPKTL